MADAFSSQEERLSFLERAAKDGIYLRMPDGIPCAVTEPEPCLNKATWVLVRYVSGVLRIEASLCRDHAEKVAKLYE